VTILYLILCFCGNLESERKPKLVKPVCLSFDVRKAGWSVLALGGSGGETDGITSHLLHNYDFGQMVFRPNIYNIL
jgi:hypothetical protein